MTTTDKYAVEGSFNLKTSRDKACMLYFIRIYLSLLEICKECLMRGGTKTHTKYSQ